MAYTIEEYAKLKKITVDQAHVEIYGAQPKKQAKKRKYNNQPVEKKEGSKKLKFGSKKEAQYYEQVKMLKGARYKKDRVVKIECQVPFELQPAFTKNGKKYQPMRYIADFRVTYADGRVEVVDVKGYDKKNDKFLITKDFALKKKIFEYKYKHLTIKIV